MSSSPLQSSSGPPLSPSGPEVPLPENGTLLSTSSSQDQSDSASLLAVLREAQAAGSHSADEILRAIADAARILTGAHGCAIGLQTGSQVVCRARSGEIAPELGATLNVDSGISGACFRSAEIMRCDDSEHDDRVDPEVCRLFGIRSIAAIPLRGISRTIGILEVFSNHAQAFAADPVAMLQSLGEIAEAVYQKEVAAKNVALVAPVEAASNSPALAPATIRLQSEAVVPVFSQPSPRSTRRYWLFSAVAVLLLMAFAVVWWTWREPESETATSAQPIRAAQPSPEAASNSPALSVVPSKPSPGVNNRPATKPQTNGLLQNAAKLEPVGTAAAAHGKSTPDRAVGAANTAAKGTASPTDQQAPPVLVANPSTSDDKLSGIVSTSSAPLPSLQTRISEGVTQAELLHKVEPVYPAEAMNSHVSGSVTLNASVAEDGTITHVEVVRGHPLLAEAAVAAVRQWRYGPSLLNGKPIAVQREVTIVFKLP